MIQEGDVEIKNVATSYGNQLKMCLCILIVKKWPKTLLGYKVFRSLPPVLYMLSYVKIADPNTFVTFKDMVIQTGSIILIIAELYMIICMLLHTR